MRCAEADLHFHNQPQVNRFWFRTMVFFNMSSFKIALRCTGILLLPILPADAALYLAAAKQFYLKLSPLERGFGPEGRSVVLTAMNAFEATFEAGWKTAIEAGNGTMGPFIPEFYIRSDIGIGASRRPNPGQYPAGEGSFVQISSYFISSIIVNGFEEVGLQHDEWSKVAFANNSFVPFLQAEDEDGIFAGVTSVEYVATADFTPGHIVETNVKILYQELYLEFGTEDERYKSSKAADIVDALDEFFPVTITPAIVAAVEDNIPGAIVYGTESPFLSGGYFSSGSYNIINGELSKQFVTDKPSVVTAYEYGWEVHYWKPLNVTGGIADIIPPETIVNSAFADNAFLGSVQAAGWPNATFAVASEVYLITNPPSVSPMPSVQITAEPTAAPMIDVNDEPTKETTIDANEEPTGSPVSAASTLAFNMMVALFLVVGVAMF
jgi:hypothetical protein